MIYPFPGTEFDQNGRVKTTAGEFSKTQLCAEHGLQPRDLRKIDSRFIDQLPAILVRDRVILINLAHIRALIKADAVVLFDPYGSTDSYIQSIFIYDLQDRLRSSGGTSASNPGQPFEFRALEAILISVTGALQSEAQVLHGMTTKLLSSLEEEIDRERLKLLLRYSKRLSLFDRKVSTLRAAILDVLDQDEDLADMYLTDIIQGKPHDPRDHEDVEILLEAYLKQVEEVANIVANLSANVRSTEEIVNIILDSQRNSLLLFELRMAMGTLGLSGGTLVAGLFGMNLLSGWETRESMFAVMTGLALSITGVIWVVASRKLRRLQRRT